MPLVLSVSCWEKTGHLGKEWQQFWWLNLFLFYRNGICYGCGINYPQFVTLNGQTDENSLTTFTAIKWQYWFMMNRATSAIILITKNIIRVSRMFYKNEDKQLYSTYSWKEYLIYHWLSLVKGQMLNIMQAIWKIEKILSSKHAATLVWSS